MAKEAFATHVNVEDTTTRQVKQHAPSAEQESTKIRRYKKTVSHVPQENTPAWRVARRSLSALNAPRDNNKKQQPRRHAKHVLEEKQTYCRDRQNVKIALQAGKQTVQAKESVISALLANIRMKTCKKIAKAVGKVNLV